MFFQRGAIEKHLTCKICNKLFDDPRFLPCSHTFCNLCIMSHEKWIDCPKCKARHEIQPSGFPINGMCVDLLEEQAKEVIQSQRVKELRQKLASIDSKCKSVKTSLIVGSDEIKEYCSSLRQKIDLATEAKIEEIRKINEAFKKQVNQYEEECLASYEPISVNIEQEIDNFLNETNKFYAEANQILSGFEVKDDQVDELIKESAEKLSLIDAKDRLLERKKFNEHLLLFEPEQSKLESLCMGWIKNKSLSILMSSVKPLNVAAPKDKILVQVAYSPSNQLIYVAYQVDHYIELAFYDMNGSPVGTNVPIKLYKSNSGYINCTLLSFLSCQDDCILAMKNTQTIHHLRYYYQVYFTDSYPYNLPVDTQTFFVKINKDRIYMSSLGVSHHSEFQASNSTNFFCFDRVNSKVWVYTSNLVDTASHFTENIPAETRDLQANEENLFVLHLESDQMKVRVIDIEGGTVKQEISLQSVNFNQFKLISSDYLIAFNNEKNKVSLIYSNDTTVEKFNHHLDKESTLAKSFDNHRYLLSKDSSPYIVLFNSREIKSYCFIEQTK